MWHKWIQSKLNWKVFVVYCALLSLVFHFFAATFSTGYQNSDEHFQIIEFLNYRLGRTPISDLAIEFHYEIRSWLQPLLYEIPTRALLYFEIDNPFLWAWIIRLISAFFGWLSIVYLINCVPLWIRDEKWKVYTVLLLVGTWYLPAFHARHSAENLSSSFFLLGICTLLLKTNMKEIPAKFGIAAGLLLGLSFEFRFQLGIMILGALAWMIVIQKTKWKGIFTLLLGIGIALGLGFCADRIGYGHWVFTPWNYIQFNFFEKNIFPPGEFHPWWDYFRRIWTETVPFLGFVSLMGLLLGFFKAPLNIFTWSLLPFFLVHMLIGHKETRFLFPMLNVAPLLLVLGLLPEKPWYNSNWVKNLTIGTLIFNGITLIAMCFIPASMSNGFYEDVFQKKIQEIYYDERNPYLVLGLPMNFYRPHGLVIKRLEETLPKEFWLGYPRAHLEQAFSSRYKVNCEITYSTFPAWIKSIDKFSFLWRATDWSLFRCKSE